MRRPLDSQRLRPRTALHARLDHFRSWLAAPCPGSSCSVQKQLVVRRPATACCPALLRSGSLTSRPVPQSAWLLPLPPPAADADAPRGCPPSVPHLQFSPAMSREEVSACLRNLQLSLDGLQRELEGSIRALPETKRWELGGSAGRVQRQPRAVLCP